MPPDARLFAETRKTWLLNSASVPYGSVVVLNLLVSGRLLSLLTLIVSICWPATSSCVHRGLLANARLEFFGVELIPILQQEAIVLHDLVLDLGQRSYQSTASLNICHPSAIICLRSS